MKKIAIFALCCVIFVGCSFFNEGKNTSLKEEFISFSDSTDVPQLAQAVAPAVVGISSTDTDGTSVGSGVCVASGGYVLTNSHVISNPLNISVHLYGGDSVKGELVFDDSAQDIAVVRANATLPYLKLADTDSVMVGEDVLAVGTPLSLTLKHTFTKGIVSALNRTIRVNTYAGEAYMQNLIQHDASINPGNSGGPLINAKGEVVGINTLKISGGEGIGFAIPSKSIQSLLSNIIKNDDYVAPYLGVYGYDSEIACYYGDTHLSNGVYILDINENSPLKESGVKNGDVITKFNGRKITNMLDLRDELFKTNVGDEIKIGFVQGGIYKESYINLVTNPHTTIKQ